MVTQLSKIERKNLAIENSRGISDAWDITIAYGGRLASWILFMCMVSNIVQVSPGVSIPPVVTTIVMTVQVITLDIAGFGLSSIAKHVSKLSSVQAQQASNSAKRLSIWLIGLMIVTLCLITLGWLDPAIATYTEIANKALILGRVILTVLYMHSMHALSEAESEAVTTKQHIQQANDKLALENQAEIHKSNQRLDQFGMLLERVSTQLARSVDYEEMAQAIIPYLPAPESQVLDYHQIANVMAPLFESRVSNIKTVIVEEIRATLSPVQITPVSNQVITGHAHLDTPKRPTLDTGHKKPVQVDTQKTAKVSNSVSSLEQSIRDLLQQDASISGRAIAKKLGCSPTTASNWKLRIESERIN